MTRTKPAGGGATPAARFTLDGSLGSVRLGSYHGPYLSSLRAPSNRSSFPRAVAEDPRMWRKYGDGFWTGEFADRIRGDVMAQNIAQYLIGTHHTNMIGLFRCPIDYIARDTGLDPVLIKEALEKISREQTGTDGNRTEHDPFCSGADFPYCFYDFEREWVFVTEFSRIQFGDCPNPRNKKTGPLVECLRETFRECRRSFVGKAFLERYGEDWIEILEKSGISAGTDRNRTEQNGTERIMIQSVPQGEGEGEGEGEKSSRARARERDDAADASLTPNPEGSETDPDPEAPRDAAGSEALTDFALEVEATFHQECGLARALGSEEQAQVFGWHSAGVPLELIRRVLRETMVQVRSRNSKKRVSSLLYFVNPVEEAVATRRRLGTGRRPDAGPAPEAAPEPVPVPVESANWKRIMVALEKILKPRDLKVFAGLTPVADAGNAVTVLCPNETIKFIVEDEFSQQVSEAAGDTSVLFTTIADPGGAP